MSEPKAKTLQMKLGFFDEDLKKPMHDEILKWIDSNAIKIINDLFELSDWNSTKIEFLKKYCDEIIDRNKRELEYKAKELNQRLEQAKSRIIEHQKNPESDHEFFNINRLNTFTEEKDDLVNELQKTNDELLKLKNCLQLAELPNRQKVKIIDKVWEFPVCSTISSASRYNAPKNIIGFIDIRIRFSFTELTVTGINFESKKVIGNIKWEETNRYIDYKSGNELNLDKEIYFEAKTAIPSLGELFRQMRMYQEFIQGQFIIVCPDDKEKSLIIEQGFKFLKYEP